MKVLILTLTIGAGHNHVANNVATEFKKEKGVSEVLTFDLFEQRPFRKWVYASVGFSGMQKFPRVSDYFYNRSFKTKNQVYSNLAKGIKKKVIEKINDFAPDVIVSTHIVGRLLVRDYAKEIKKQVLSYFIVTDYDLTPGLDNFSQNEYIVVPGRQFKIELSEKKIDSKKILAYGIPIKESFYQPLSKEQAIKQLNLNLDSNKKTVLVTGGGKGKGKSLQVIKELLKHEEFQIICVSGRNEKLKQSVDKLNKKHSNKIISFGFTKDMDCLMSVSDFIVGKAGGITSTEAIAKKLPLISIGRTPKPEFANLKFLIKNNMAAQVKKPKHLRQILNDLNVELMKKSYEEFLIKDSAKKIVTHAINTSPSNKK